MGALSPWHWAILVIVLILLFGAKRLPDAARSIGRSMKIFKAETKGLRDEDDESKKDSEGTVSAETRQLPQGEAAPRSDDQVAELQRQLDEMKKQQANQAHKNAS
ncbi:MAG: Sec-independent protein translocase subunit TatA [Haloechinothrix sp.]